MNVLKKCCFRSLRENRRRTAVTIIGVILATALITAVACVAVSCRASLIAYEKAENGDYNYWFQKVSGDRLAIFRNNRNIKRMGIAENKGYAELEGSTNPDKPYVYVRSLDREGFDALSLKLIVGRLPQNAGEIVISNHIRTNGMVDLQVGDSLVLQVGERMSEGYVLGQSNPYVYDVEELLQKEEKTYEIVGIVERPNYVLEERTAPGYSVFTYLEDADAAENLDVFVTYTSWGMKHDREVTAGILGLTTEEFEHYYRTVLPEKDEDAQIRQTVDSVTENYWLNKWIKFRFSSGIMNLLYGMAALAILVIIVTSVFCIRNSFVISLTEKMKLYGRLASVGTTSRQQKNIVFYEARFIGGVGIPLGVLSGLAAAWILITAVGGMVEDGIGIRLIFGTSLPALAAAAVLAAVTVYFSAAGSARKASKVSPISAIRGNDTIRNPKRLSCPKFVGRIFGVGGTIAYKNLKRARVKYRTTVISIVVSVAVFIGLSTFVQLVSLASGIYYKNIDYQLRVYVSGEDAYEKAVSLTKLEGVRAAEILRAEYLLLNSDEVPYTREYLSMNSPKDILYCRVIALGEEGYRRYCEKLGVTVEQAQGKAIVYAEFSETSLIGEKLVVNEGKIASYKPGDRIRGSGQAVTETYEGAGMKTESAVDIEIDVLLQTKEKPISMSNKNYNTLVLIVSDRWLEDSGLSSEKETVEIYIQSEEADELEATLYGAGVPNTNLINYDAEYRSNKNLCLVIAIFLYGFITVVSLVGITNIFNTVTTNMELRAPEFAMLRSLGMTGREFRRMIWLEGFFYGGKALLIGIPAGILISLGFHKSFGEGIIVGYRFPAESILLASAAVFLLLFAIMKYSVGKINKRNVVETIQNENI